MIPCARCSTAWRNCDKGGRVYAAWAVGFGGIAEGVFKMGLGNKLGFRFECDLSDEELFAPQTAAFLLECDAAPEGCELLGEITADYALTFRGETLSMDALQKPYEEKLQSVFPYLTPSKDEQVPVYRATGKPVHAPRRDRAARACSSRSSPAPTANTTPPAPLSAPAPSRRSWSCATCTAQDIEESPWPHSRKLAQDAQIIAHPRRLLRRRRAGGLAPSSSPLSSAIPQCTDAVHELLQARDGLMLGICNGFQALIKLGLVPFGQHRGDRRLLPDADLQRHRPPPVRCWCARAWPPTSPRG